MRKKCWIFIFFAWVSLFAEEVNPDMTIAIPMRDGYILPTDIYLPYPEAKGLPCILVRTPSQRRYYYQSYQPLTKAGYIVAIQDCRSGTDKEGKTLPYIHDGWGEAQDGYDTIEWLAHCPLTNGKIATMGFSAMGITQLLVAPTSPKGLIAQHIGFAAPCLYNHVIYNGGQVQKSQVEGWLGHHAKDPSVIQCVLSEDETSPLWRALDAKSKACDVALPAVHYGGWYDTFLNGTIDAFLMLQNWGADGARGRQKLIIGPWTHHWPRDKRLGDYAVPTEGYSPPYDLTPETWFSHHLKGEDQGIDTVPAVQYFVMGPFDGSSKGNVWKTASDWPIPSTPLPFFLSSDHTLTIEPDVRGGAYAFRYDPEWPVPTLGGRNLFLESGPKDQSPIEKRPDMVLFTSGPLEEDIEVTGHVMAHLFVSSDCEDTDIVVRLTDVYPDGRSLLIADGIRRLSAVQTYKPQEPIEVAVDLSATSQIFAKGHRIRLSVTSSNYPRFEKNLNTPCGEEPKVATNAIHFGLYYPSRLVLPVVNP